MYLNLIQLVFPKWAYKPWTHSNNGMGGTCTRFKIVRQQLKREKAMLCLNDTNIKTVR